MHILVLLFTFIHQLCFCLGYVKSGYSYFVSMRAFIHHVLLVVMDKSIQATAYQLPVGMCYTVPRRPFQSTTPSSSKYHTTLVKVPHHSLQNTTPPFSKYHIAIIEVPHHPLSKYNTTLLKIPHHPLQSTAPQLSKYYATIEINSP